jgi:hypothetical protein
MSNALENHGYQPLARLEKNSKSVEALLVGYGEEAEVYGDHSPHTTSGITTTELILSAETWASVKVLDPIPETTTIEKTLIPKLETEDAQVETLTSSNAESMVDQTKMTRALKLMSNAQVDHGYKNGKKLVKNSDTPLKVGSTEKEEEIFGDQSPPTTSGTTTMVPTSSAEIWDMVKVLEPKPETITTEKTLIKMLDTDDALEATITFSNVEDMVDQTTMTRVLKLMSNVQELHGLQFGRRPEVNSELPLKDLSIDVEVIRDGDH